jgi:hypothetical protein
MQGKKNEYFIYWTFFISCLWALTFGLRRIDVGNDTFFYSMFFENKSDSTTGYLSGGTIDHPGETIESGFVMFSRFVHFFTNSSTVYFTIISFWLLFVIRKLYILVSGYKLSIWNMFFVFTVTNSFVVFMVAVRQSISICMLLTGICFIIWNHKRTVEKRLSSLNERRKKFASKANSRINKWSLLSLVFIGFSFVVHRSAMLLFPFLVVAYFVRFNKKTVYLILCSSFFISLFFLNKISYLFDSVLLLIGNIGQDKVALLGDRYADSFGENSLSVITKILWLIPALITTRLLNEDKIKSFFYTCYVFSVSVALLLSGSHMVERLNIVLVVLGFTCFVPEKVLVSKRWRNIYMLITFVFLMLAFSRYIHWPDSDSCIPYHFFWE